MMSNKVILLKVLINGIEDISALYEIVWDLYGKDVLSHDLERVITIFSKLRKLELVKLYWCQEPYGDIKEIIDVDESIQLISEKKYWFPPSTDVKWLRFETTQMGEDLYCNLCNGNVDADIFLKT